MRRILVALQPGPNVRALETAVRILLALGVAPSECYLGGGTALAARWRHRISDDIDLFAAREILHEIEARAGGPRMVAAILEKAGGWNIDTERGQISWETANGPAGLFPSVPYLKAHLGDEVEAKHRIPMERNASVLSRKILARMLARETLADRDAYDLVACARKDPASLREAMEVVRRPTGISSPTTSA